MRITNELIQEVTKELVTTNNIQDVNVVFLCNYLKIRRQTFYYHYQNIYDVIESIFIEDARKFLNLKIDISSFKEMVEIYLEKNNKFLTAIANSNLQELLEKFFNDIFYNYYSNSHRREKSYKDYKARFVASGCSNLLINLFTRYKDSKTNKEIIEYTFSQLE